MNSLFESISDKIQNSKSLNLISKYKVVLCFVAFYVIYVLFDRQYRPYQSIEDILIYCFTCTIIAIGAVAASDRFLAKLGNSGIRVYIIVYFLVIAGITHSLAYSDSALVNIALENGILIAINSAIIACMILSTIVTYLVQMSRTKKG